MGFTRVNRTRKTHIKPSDAGLVVARHGLQYTVAGDAVRAEAVQNRCIESCFSGDARVSMQGVAVAAQRINHGLVTSLGQFTNRVWGTIRNGMRLWSALSTASKAAVASVKQGSAQRKERIAGR